MDYIWTDSEFSSGLIPASHTWLCLLLMGLFQAPLPWNKLILFLQDFKPANLNILIMSKKFKMMIKYCVKPQTVLTVQKENAFFAAPIRCALAHLWPYYFSGLFRIPRLLPLFQTKLLSRWTDQWDKSMAISATEGPVGAGSTVALPREVMCWQEPLQLQPVAFWRAPARTGTQCPTWASSKSNPVAAPKMGSSLECHLPWEWEALWQWSTCDSLGTSAPQSLWPQPNKECLIPILSWWALTRTDARHLKKFTPVFRIVHNCLRPPPALETQCWTPLKVHTSSTGDWCSPRMTLLKALAWLHCSCKTCGSTGYVTSPNFLLALCAFLSAKIKSS